METILLGFCLISLGVSSIIVVIQITLDRRKQRHAAQQFEGNHTYYKPIQGGHRLTPASASKLSRKSEVKALDLLDRQLKPLGYITHAQQLKFVNWALHSEHHDLTHISSEEFQLLFGIIRRYKLTQKPAVNEALPQSA